MDMAQRLAKCSLSNGDFIFLSGTLELEEFTKKDGITKDKRLKLRLDDWAPVPQKRETIRPVQNETEVFPVTAEQIDGDREELPE